MFHGWFDLKGVKITTPIGDFFTLEDNKLEVFRDYRSVLNLTFCDDFENVSIDDNIIKAISKLARTRFLISDNVSSLNKAKFYDLTGKYLVNCTRSYLLEQHSKNVITVYKDDKNTVTFEYLQGRSQIRGFKSLAKGTVSKFDEDSCPAFCVALSSVVAKLNKAIKNENI